MTMSTPVKGPTPPVADSDRAIPLLEGFAILGARSATTGHQWHEKSNLPNLFFGLSPPVLPSIGAAGASASLGCAARHHGDAAVIPYAGATILAEADSLRRAAVIAALAGRIEPEAADNEEALGGAS